MTTIITISIYLLIFLMTARPSQAYLDPGSGSFIFQMLVGAVIGGLITLKAYYRKIKSAIKKYFSNTKKTDDKSNK